MSQTRKTTTTWKCDRCQNTVEMENNNADPADWGFATFQAKRTRSCVRLDLCPSCTMDTQKFLGTGGFT